jgi:Methyltransferase domain
MKISKTETSAPNLDVDEGILSLQLRCPSCARPLTELPHSKKRPFHLRCSYCRYTMTVEDSFCDARLNKERRTEFSRLWALWEEGRLGDPGLVYGVSPADNFRQVLSTMELSEDDLKNMKILEIGFGHGRLLQEIQQYCVTAYGIDVVMPLASSSFRPGTIICGDLFNIPIMPGQFDLVICKGVIETTPWPKKAFDCVAEQIAQKGKLFITVEETGRKRSLLLRKLLPGFWLYPESLRLAIAGFLSVPRGMLEELRQGKFDAKSFNRYRGNAKLGIFDILSPRFGSTHSKEEIMSWFTSNGLEVRRIGVCHYVGSKK